MMDASNWVSQNYFCIDWKYCIRWIQYFQSIKVSSIKNDIQISSRRWTRNWRSYTVRSEYLHLMEKLNYLTASRPHILTTLSYSATKCKNPTDQDLQQLLTDCLLSQTDKWLRFDIISTERKWINRYLPNSKRRRCLYESYRCVFTCKSLGSIQPSSYFYSKSSKQQNIATSSTHAEIRALYELTMNIVYLLTLFEEMTRPI